MLVIFLLVSNQLMGWQMGKPSDQKHKPNKQPNFQPQEGHHPNRKGKAQ
ncbi:hypothetical protein VOA_000584 [Vibrio sp. RC586]|nr:hypothetical protein VOA_000584 [Vibrio sp. RC586]